MNWQNLITVVGGALLTVLPQVIGALPAPYKDIASAVIAAAMSMWHLYQPAPSGK